jgi:hypothetical protein
MATTYRSVDYGTIMLWYEVYNTCLNTVEAAASVVRAPSTTAGETFEMMVSSELSKARSRFGDAPACETSAGASLALRAAVDCAGADVAVRKQATTPFFIHK